MPAPDPATHPPAPSAAPVWQLRLLGAVEARHGTHCISRWPSRAAIVLLARLALAPERAHPREELVELLWPGVALDVGRNRLRQVLSTLKTAFEAAGPPVISADRHQLRLRPGSLRCDALEFEALARKGLPTGDLYGGELLPGHYDEWVLERRTQLAALHERVQARLAEAGPVGVADPLPASWTRVFGIEHTASRLMALVQHERLVSVVGPGGGGKTRLCLEAARALRDARDGLPTATTGGLHFGRIVFVPLVECRDRHQALDAVVRAFHLTAADPMPQLRAALAGGHTLVLLDNFEQLVGSAASLPLALLEAAPGLHLLVSSRMPLGLPGEQVFRLPGLPLPAADADTGTLAGNPAVALFFDRARAAHDGFAAGDGNLPVVGELVRLLDGQPLAIELAASRVRSLAPARLLQLLRDEAGAHLALLAREGSRAGHDDRQASIAAVIDWSWRLLGPEEQRLLAALSCCAGGAGLPLLASMTGERPAQVAARADALCGHSMARATAADDRAAPRYELIESVRDFVRARWPAPALQALQQALQRWLLDWALALGPDPRQATIDAERRNVLATLSMPADPLAVPLRLAVALRAEWDSAGMPAGVQAALAALLQGQPTATDLLPAGLASAAHELLAYVRFEAGFVAQAQRHADRALALAGDDPGPRARALVRQAWVRLASAHGEDDGGPTVDQLAMALDEALQLGETAGDAEAQARCLHQQAVLASQWRGDWAAAERLNARAQHLWQVIGDPRKADARLRNRGQCWVRLGRSAEARQCFERCEQAARERGDVVGQIDSQLSLSTLLSSGRQWRQALAVDRRCITLCWQRWHRHGLAYALWNPPRSLARLRRPVPALRLMAFAATFWESGFGPLARADRQAVRRVRALVRAQLGDQRAEALWAEGAAMPIAQAVELALTPWEDMPGAA